MNKYKLSEVELEILNKQIIKQYCEYYKIEIDYNITPEFQNNKYKETIAIWIAKNQCLIPKQWIHNYTIKDKYGKTLKDIIIKNNMPIPQEWKIEKEMTIFDKAYFSIVPNIDGHESNEQDEQGYTIAMLLAMNNIEIPNEWCHDPSLQNKSGKTVAMYQALNGKIPDKQWQHNKYLRGDSDYDSLYYTVQNILQDQNIQVPDEWKYTPMNDHEDNQAIIDAKKGIIPKFKNNNPNYQNICGDTVAMLLVDNNIVPPRQWMNKYTIKNSKGETLNYQLQNIYLPTPDHWYDDDMDIFDQACFGIIPDIQGHQSDEINNKNQTVAMILTILNKEIPKQWEHNPSIQDNEGNTVAMHLIKRNKIPEEQWYHNPEIQDNQGQTIAMMQILQGKMPDKQWEHRGDLQNNSKKLSPFFQLKKVLYLQINGFTIHQYKMKIKKQWP